MASVFWRTHADIKEHLDMGRVKGMKHEEVSHRNPKFVMTERNLAGQLDKQVRKTDVEPV